MTDEMPVTLAGVSYLYGKGALSKQILYDINAEIRAGEIVILTGPSGSGKTTLLTLMGALRSAQQGSVKVLGHELNRARDRTLVRVRRQIGYIFQSHNLLESLTIGQNVQMGLKLDPGGGSNARQRIAHVLDRVGLGEHIHKHPGQLSGGQKQRAGIARALVNRPRIILADEPTASLDKQSGRDVVELIQELAREDGAAVVLVTHDNRILDIADRILHLEDGHMKPLGEAVAEGASRMLNLLGKHEPGTASYLAAFSFALARVAHADDVVTDSERAQMRRVLHDVAHLETSEVEFIMELSMMQHRAHDSSRISAEHNALLAERQDHFVESLFTIAGADGEVDDVEIEEIRRIAAEFGLQHSRFAGN